MTLTQMQYFYTVCKYENYTRAAQELYVSQPAISQAMKELEIQCGVPLFQRQGNTLVLTEEGAVLYSEVRIILEQMDHLGHVIKDLSLRRDYVRIGLSTFSGNTVFPLLRRQFHLLYPHIQVISQEDTTEALFYLLDAGQVDFILTSPGGYIARRDAEKKYHIRDILRSGMKLCVHHNHPLAKRSRAGIADVLEEPMVMMVDRYSPTKTIKKLFRENGVEPNVIHYTNQMYTIERFIEQGAAIGFLPQEIIMHNREIVGLEFEGIRHRYVSLHWKKKQTLYPACELFIRTAEQIREQISG